MPQDSSPDPVHQFEHDHVHMSQLVDELRELINVTDLQALSADQHATLVDTLGALHDDLLLHFAQEEEGLFPFLTTHLPETAPEVAAILATHDALCGAAGRMLAMAQRGHGSLNAARPAFSALFRRFDESYVGHARDECAFLRTLHGKLDEGRVAELLRLLEGL